MPRRTRTDVELKLANIQLALLYDGRGTLLKGRRTPRFAVRRSSHLIKTLIVSLRQFCLVFLVYNTEEVVEVIECFDERKER